MLPLLKILADRQHLANLSLFYRYYFGKCSFELAELVSPPHSRDRSTRYSNRLHDFPVTIPRYHKDVYVNSLFSCTVRLWNTLLAECLPLNFYLNDLIPE